MNEYDSNRMRDLLGDCFQFEEVNTPEQADLILLNTCSIRERPKRKFFINWEDGRN